MTAATPQSQEALLRRVGQRIKAARLAQGLSQDQVAHRVGVSRSSIANLEAGRQNMEITRLAVVSAAVKLNPADLIRPEDLPPLPPDPPPPHQVTIRRAWEVTCETCAPGQPFDTTTDRAAAFAARRKHIADNRDAS